MTSPHDPVATMSKSKIAAPTADRHDPLHSAYESAESWERVSRWIDWLSLAAFAAYAGLHALHDPQDWIAKSFFVVLAAIAICLRLYFDIWLQFEVDRQRRLTLVSDSLGVALTHHQPRGFWTSPHRPSFVRMLFSVAENSFFYPRLLRSQLVVQCIFVCLAFTLFLVSLRVGTLEFIELFVLLVLLGDGGLGRFLRLVWGRWRYRQLCEQCLTSLRRHFAGEQSADLTRAEAVAFLAEYEVVKARCRIRASSAVFDRLNPVLTQQWNAQLATFNLPSTSAKQD